MALQITDQNFKEILASNPVVVLDFWAEWCGPCKKIAPVIDELAETFAGKAAIGKVEVEENDELCSQFGIRNIPSVLFFKNGELVDKQVGAAEKKIYQQKIEALIEG